MGMVSEFKEFVSGGNTMDMATGIIIGAAVTALVTSLVDDIIMPVVGLFTGGTDFSSLFMVLGEGTYDTLKAAQEAGASVFAYGAFINAIINFLIISFVIFMIIKGVNSMKKKEAEAPAEPPEDLVLLREIRDSLKK
jgi:large conductance mechanosensitive channel